MSDRMALMNENIIIGYGERRRSRLLDQLVPENRGLQCQVHDNGWKATVCCLRLGP